MLTGSCLRSANILQCESNMALPQINPQSKIYVAGHRGMVGSAMVRLLEKKGFENIVVRTRAELDLCDQAQVNQFFKAEKPEFAFIAAAKVGGILANQSAPTEFLYENLMIATNTIRAAAENGTEKLLFLGSSCIFPKFADQPLREESMLSGALEPTNEAYAIAKIAGLKLAEYFNKQHGKRFISAMPPNLYGYGDNFHLENSHVIPGLMRRMHEAKLAGAPVFTAWGTGTPLREFMFVDDLAEGCFFLLQHYEDALFMNVGSGEETTILELVHALAEVIGYTGKIEFDSTKPDGTPRKVMDSSRVRRLGWRHQVSLREGLKVTYNWFLQNHVS
jgi:GDP-L-fucose synthase